ncbi:MAG TPA: hypothetical protein VGM88_19045 [Kofleriaceae bacterium]|jgi:hypothetical protein
MTRSPIWLLLAIAGGAAAGAACKDLDCGDGTVERDGACVPSDQTVGTASCGPNTTLVGDQCLPSTPPTMCDPATTMAIVNDAGVTVCYGTGGGGCSTPIACDAPTDGTETVCGQIYDLATDLPFQGAATGAQCAGTETTGPCALAIQAYDGQMFATDPSSATPLATGSVYIDDCGRFRVPNIALPASPLLGLGFDDRNAADRGPTGVTNAVGIATSRGANMAFDGIEGWIADPATTTAWATSGAPTIAEGYFVPIFRGHSTGRDDEAGVTLTRNGTPPDGDAYYFTAGQANRTTIDTGATVTSGNGAVLVDHANLGESLAYTGTYDVLPAGCKYESHVGATLAGIVLVQIFRPTNIPTFQCNL